MKPCQTALNPHQPPPNVLANAGLPRILLIKLAYSFDEPFSRRRGHTCEPRLIHLIPKKRKPTFGTTNEGLIGMLLDTQFRQGLVHHSHCVAKLPCGRLPLTIKDS